MIVKKPRNNEGYYDLLLTDRNNKSFTMTVGGNFDLFWIPENHKEDIVFEIDKSDRIAFAVFSQLFNAVKKVDDKYRPVMCNNTITFISEDWPEDEANVLKIFKTEDTFVINFIKNTNEKAWSFPHRHCMICFCNSGSRVPRVEQLFMEMFNYLAYNCDSIKCEDESKNNEI